MSILVLLSVSALLVAPCATQPDNCDVGTPSGIGTGDLGTEQATTEPVGIDIPDPRRPTCGGLFFDSTQHTCCDNVVNILVSRFNNPNIRCCGNKTYDMTRQICCMAHFPISVKIKPNRACCGRAYIDTIRSMCCNGRQFRRTSADTCCGRDAYKKAQRVCCRRADGSLHARRGNACCAGKTFFNTNPRRFCCDGLLGEMKLKIQSGRGRRTCCGISLMDPDREVCCAGVKVKRTNL